MNKILLIDDDHDITALLNKFLSKHGYEVEIAYSGSQGEKLLASFDPDLVMCDYRLDDMDGSVLLVKIKERKPNIPVIIMTGYSDLRTAIRVVRMGAFDYITKPFIPDEILLVISQALTPAPKTKNSSAPDGGTNNNGSAYLFTDSVHSKNLAKQIALVAPTDYSVIIYGESGAGKEGVARLIHDKSKRSKKPFIAMDCGAISRELAGSELFGHEKGSFTGAINQKTGHFEMANGGTLFLDEIGNLSYDTQTLLLRVLQEKLLRRIGSNKEIEIDVRIVVASNEKLFGPDQKTRFREDLFHRLNEFQIDLQPLRNRKQDILFFANHFLRDTSHELGKNLLGLEPEVEEIFLNYPWPGNVRELKNVVKRAVLLSSNSKVDVKSLPFEILNYSRISFDVEDKEPFAAGQPASEIHAHHAGADLSRPELKKAALEAEHKVILDALNQANYNKSKAAEILGIDRKTLYNKLKKIKLADK